ncbi:hypothetical protein AB0C10_36475 [Microbispora amethystogenes]
MPYKVTFIRHGGPDELTFDTHRDAQTFADWLEPSSAGVDPEITEVEEG